MEQDSSTTMSSKSLTMMNPETDFFIAFATLDGFASFRNKNKGSYFTQNLLDVWQEDFNNLQLQSLMRKVNLKHSISCYNHCCSHLFISWRLEFRIVLFDKSEKT